MTTRAVVLIALLSALTLAACGGSDNTSSPAPGGGTGTENGRDADGGGGSGGSDGGGGGATSESGRAAQTLKVTAGEPGPEEYSFAPADLKAKAGEVTLDLVLPDDLNAPHAIAIEGDGVSESGDTVSAGATSSVSAELPAGEYTFFCPVGDHREEGMEGTLTVG